MFLSLHADLSYCKMESIQQLLLATISYENVLKISIKNVEVTNSCVIYLYITSI